MKTAKIENIKDSALGTTRVDMAAGNMRKPQSFIVYPIDKSSDGKVLKLQSDNYWAEIDSETGKGELSGRRSNYANSWTFAADKAAGKTKLFKLSPVDLQALRLQVFATASDKAGNAVMTTDNSGAINILK